jgi:drug/metabolite transporter (DMT)-like permease
MIAGVLPALAAAVGFAVFQIVNARVLARIDVYRATRITLVLGTLILGTLTVISDGPGPWLQATPRALLMSAAAGMLHFFLGWTLLGIAQQRIGVARTGALIGSVPLFGALSAWVLLGERLVVVQTVGLLAAAAGVAFVATASSGPVGGSGRDAALGVAAALGTAMCWSVSPVLIREGLAGIPSPGAAASVGLLTSAALYTLLIALVRRGSRAPIVEGRVRRLLGLGGALVAFSLWFQWAAFERATVAVVLVTLQLTPALVPLLTRIGAPAGSSPPLRRVYTGVTGIVGGSLLVILLR